MKKIRLAGELIANEMKARQQNILDGIDPYNDFNAGYIEGMMRAFTLVMQAQIKYGVREG